MPITVTYIDKDSDADHPIGTLLENILHYCHTASNNSTIILPGILWKNKVTLQFERTITLNEQAILYDTISLLAEMGGYVGVLCGYSILCFADFLFAVTNIRLEC